MRALVATNMYPSTRHPGLGSFVHDQVQALRRIDGIEIELFHFEPGTAGGYARAANELRRRYRGQTFDVVHAHYGLTAWPALAAPARVRAVTLHGTDLHHWRTRPITLAALRAYDLVGAVGESLRAEIPRWATRRPTALLPCGVDVLRFRPIPRAQARAALGLDADRPHLLFPSDPRRAEKRYDLARTLAGDTRLLTLVDVDPSRVPLWVNAANAELVPSDREGFGLAVLEALACEVPVLATPVGIASDALAGLSGTHCGPFELATWRSALAPHLAADDPRLVGGRERAERFSTDRMAARVVRAWTERCADDAGR
jgi:glycosyltransferase involved in cell wall biosynthesis